MDKCVRRLTRNGASISTSTNKVETLLQLLVGPEYAALDPRLSPSYGANLHTNCVKSIFENAVLARERQGISRIALRYALCHTECPLSSIELLCEYGEVSDAIEESESTLSDRSHRTVRCCTLISELQSVSDFSDICNHWIMRTTPLEIATKFCAYEAVMSTLLKHGANPRLHTEHESTSASSTRPNKQIKEPEHESRRKKTVFATPGRTWLQSIPSLPRLFRKKQNLYIEPSKTP